MIRLTVRRPPRRGRRPAAPPGPGAGPTDRLTPAAVTPAAHGRPGRAVGSDSAPGARPVSTGASLRTRAPATPGPCPITVTSHRVRRRSEVPGRLNRWRSGPGRLLSQIH
eukprot:755779-Hanusia_phi.AAC.1